MTTMEITSPVLVCAATRWEAEPLARRFSGAGRRTVRVVRTGVGARRAAEALEALALERTPGVACVVSAGFAGALQPELRPGDIVADLRGCDAEWPEWARAAAAEAGLRLHFGRILHSDAVVGAPALKRALGQRERAIAVDMESAPIRDWAARRQVPAFAARAILDTIDEPLPEVLPDGDDAYADDLGGALRFALRNVAAWPTLARLAWRQRRAMAGLGAFLAGFIDRL